MSPGIYISLVCSSAHLKFITCFCPNVGTGDSEGTWEEAALGPNPGSVLTGVRRQQLASPLWSSVPSAIEGRGGPDVL